MPDFYYQIKGRRDDGSFSDWHWPPLLSGKVTAENKKAARKCVEELHGQSFPMRVKQEDKDKFLYLLNIREIAPDDTRTQEYFDDKKCLQCDSTFKLIDIYNDGLRTPGGRDFIILLCGNERLIPQSKMMNLGAMRLSFTAFTISLKTSLISDKQNRHSHFVGTNISIKAQGRLFILPSLIVKSRIGNLAL